MKTSTRFTLLSTVVALTAWVILYRAGGWPLVFGLWCLRTGDEWARLARQQREEERTRNALADALFNHRPNP